METYICGSDLFGGMIKTIIFDLGGVYFTDGNTRAMKIFSSRYQIPHEKVKAVLSGDLGSQYRIGAITPTEFWEKAKELWNISAPIPELSLTWLREYVPIPGTVTLVKKLRSAGYETLFLSDNAPDRIEYLQQNYGFLNHFKEGVFSHMVHVRKPDIKIYRAVLDKTSSSPEECAYIDDKPELLKPAIALGMKGIVFENPAQLEKELHKLDVKF